MKRGVEGGGKKKLNKISLKQHKFGSKCVHMHISMYIFVEAGTLKQSALTNAFVRKKPCILIVRIRSQSTNLVLNEMLSDLFLERKKKTKKSLNGKILN